MRRALWGNAWFLSFPEVPTARSPCAEAFIQLLVEWPTLSDLSCSVEAVMARQLIPKGLAEMVPGTELGALLAGSGWTSSGKPSASGPKHTVTGSSPSTSTPRCPVRPMPSTGLAYPTR